MYGLCDETRERNLFRTANSNLSFWLYTTVLRPTWMVAVLNSATTRSMFMRMTITFMAMRWMMTLFPSLPRIAMTGPRARCASRM